MVDIESRGSRTPTPRKLSGKANEANAPGGMGGLQVLILVFGVGALFFTSAVLYYHYVLHIETIDVHDIDAHHLIKNELFKRVAPSFNEFTQFTEGAHHSQTINKDKDFHDEMKKHVDSSIIENDVNKHILPQHIDKQTLWLKEDNERKLRIEKKRADLELIKDTLPTHHLKCDNSNLVEFWHDHTLDDWAYETPYSSPEGSNEIKYVTFEPDVGGWNNIRMQMELVLVFAAATGRTLVLPPDQPMYLLDKGKKNQKHHSFADFFPFEYIKKRVPVITMKQFMEDEAFKGKLLNNKFPYKPTLPPPGCDGTSGINRDKRNELWEYLRNTTSCPPWKGMKDYLVIPPRPGMNTSTDLTIEKAEEYNKRSKLFAGDKRYGMDRKPQYYNQYWHEQHVIHFISKPAWGYRLLEHFYTYIHFQDPSMDRFYKRFVSRGRVE
jgi:hypothetical protein